MGRTITWAAALLLLVHVPVRAQVLVYDVFGAYLDSLRRQAGIPGLAAAIVDSDDIVWERAYGSQDIARSNATRTDTLFNADGLTQVVTAAMALRCAEEGRLSLDDRVGDKVDTSEPDATVRQLLSHTTGTPDSPVFTHRPERLQPLWDLLRLCTIDSYREAFSNRLKQHVMYDSVPGANIVGIASPDVGVPLLDDVKRYTALLQRRATPYVVDGRGRASQTTYPDSAALLTPSSGLITTVLDLAKFDLDLRRGEIIRPETLEAAWSAPAGSDGAPLPHGMGWFVQYYNGEKIVWQYGMTDNTSSSLMITLPSRRLTLILMANSDGLVKLYSPANGDISLSPFARLFLNIFVR